MDAGAVVRYLDLFSFLRGCSNYVSQRSPLRIKAKGRQVEFVLVYRSVRFMFIERKSSAAEASVAAREYRAQFKRSLQYVA